MELLYENLQKHMNTLCLACGSRHCGSEGEAKAADYIESVFRGYGYETVREEFSTVGWSLHGFSLWNVTKGRAVPGATACFFSQPVDFEGEFFWIETEDIQRLENLPVKGRLCFLEFWNDNAGVFGRNRIAEVLDKKGASGAVFISNIHSDYLPSTKIQRSPFLNRLGAAAVTLEGALDIARNKRDTYRLYIAAEKFDHTSCNVIARIPGSGRKGVIGAHYDTAPNIQGAADNATGTAVLMELARLAKGKENGWALDFCAFSGEEYIPEDFPVGSKAYYGRHKDEDLRWYLNIDDIGDLVGYRQLNLGHPEHLPEIRYDGIRGEGPLNAGDDRTFYYHDIPTVWLSQKRPSIFIHTAMDTVDMIDPERLKNGAETYFSLLRQLAV